MSDTQLQKQHQGIKYTPTQEKPIQQSSAAEIHWIFFFFFKEESNLTSVKQRLGTPAVFGRTLALSSQHSISVSCIY